MTTLIEGVVVDTSFTAVFHSTTADSDLGTSRWPMLFHRVCATCARGRIHFPTSATLLVPSAARHRPTERSRHPRSALGAPGVNRIDRPSPLPAGRQQRSN